jgi:hypothetical protein
MKTDDYRQLAIGCPDARRQPATAGNVTVAECGEWGINQAMLVG